MLGQVLFSTIISQKCVSLLTGAEHAVLFRCFCWFSFFCLICHETSLRVRQWTWCGFWNCVTSLYQQSWTGDKSQTNTLTFSRNDFFALTVVAWWGQNLLHGVKNGIKCWLDSWVSVLSLKFYHCDDPRMDWNGCPAVENKIQQLFPVFLVKVCFLVNLKKWRKCKSPNFSWGFPSLSGTVVLVVVGWWRRCCVYTVRVLLCPHMHVCLF